MNSEIINKTRIVVFTGTKDQIERQESLSRPFGVINPRQSQHLHPDSCQVNIIDAHKSKIGNYDIRPLKFVYTNWKGEVKLRTVLPLGIEFMQNEYHGEYPLWLMIAFDLDKQAMRYFDLKKIEYKGGKL